MWTLDPDFPQDPEFYRRVLQEIPTPLVVVSAEGRIVYGNNALVELTGWTKADGLEASIFQFLHPGDVEWIVEAFLTLAATPDSALGRPWAPVNCRMIRKDGTTLPVEVRGHDKMTDADIGGVIYEVRPAHERDIFQRVLTGVASKSGIETQLDLIVELIESTPIDIQAAIFEFGTDGSSVVTASSEQLADILGAASHDELRSAFVVPGDGPVLVPVVDITGALGEQLRFVGETDAWSIRVPSPTLDREYRIVGFTPIHHVPARGAIEAVTRAAELAAVVLLRERSDELLTYAAHHDQLTRLPNRHGLLTHVGRMAPREDEIAVMFIDLDGFKNINDQHGHAAGDFVLTALAERFASLTRPTDLVARVGGDEFAVVVGASSNETSASEAAGWIAERILETFSIPIESEWGDLMMTGSIGVVVVDPSADIQKAIAGADRAMYVAKSAGGARVHRSADTVKP